MGHAPHRARLWLRHRPIAAAATVYVSLIFGLDQSDRRTARIDRCADRGAPGFARRPVCTRPAGRLLRNTGRGHVVEERAGVRKPEAATEPARRRIAFGVRKASQRQVTVLEDHPAVVASGFSEFRFFVEAGGDFEIARRPSVNAVAPDGEAANRMGDTGRRGDYRAWGKQKPKSSQPGHPGAGPGGTSSAAATSCARNFFQRR